VAGRALAFSDPEIIRMAREDFVPVAGDDWYQRRRDDAEGAFFRKVADQGPRKPGGTRQGIYFFTASGKLLAFKNHQDPEVMRGVLRQALAEWKKLPDEERKPGAVTVEDLAKTDPRYARTPPEGGLVLNVYTRILDRDDKGETCRGTCERIGGDRAARDHLWLTKTEWQALIPERPKEGDQFPLPAALATRILRFHLLDNTRGEPSAWKPEEIRSKRLTLTVEEVTPKEVRLRLDGAALLATSAKPDKADRGFDARLLGFVRYDRERQTITRFDVLAVGDHWGESVYTSGARPGRKPLGITFELSGGGPADLIPPEMARQQAEYFGRGR
jgi:hypothetical protein